MSEAQPMPNAFAQYENHMVESMVKHERARSSLERALASEESRELQSIISKHKLDSRDFERLAYCLNSVEMKLLNLNDRRQYILLKYFVWVREYIRVAKKFYDLEEKLDKENTMRKEIRDIFNQVHMDMLANTKFIIDMFVGMGRSTLSLGATGFLETLKIKHELVYNTPVAGKVTQ